MDTHRREQHDNNIYIKTKLCIYIFYMYIQYILYLFILTIKRIMKARGKKKQKHKKRKEKGNKRKVLKIFTIFLFVLIRETFLLIFLLLYSLEWGDHLHLINHLDQCVIFQFSYCIIPLQVSLV